MNSPELSPADIPPLAAEARKANVPLPLIRVHRLFLRTEVVALYEDHLVAGTCFSKRPQLTEEHYQPDGEQSLKRILWGSRTVPYDQIKDVREKGLFKDQPSSFTISAKRNKLRVALKSGGALNLYLTATQMRHPSAWLSHKLGAAYQRRVVHRRSFAASVGLIVLGFLIVAVGIMGANWLGDTKLPGSGFMATVSFFAGLAGAVYVVKSKRSWQEASSVPDREPQERKRKRVAGGKSAYHSTVLGWLLKLVGLGYLLVLSVPLDAIAENWFSKLPNPGSYYQVSAYLHVLIVLPGVLLIFTGYRMCQTPYSPKKDHRGLRKIVFLRPFENDRTTSLQPDGWIAALSGLRPAWSRPNQISVDGRLSGWDLLVNAHPVRLARMFLNLAVDTSEEVLARYFSKVGPVIAIGQPGEGLPTPGAARMYLQDDQWQAAVESELQNAQIILVQPGATDGVRWELEQIRGNCDPFRVLFCLAGYWKRPDDYENLILQLRRTMQVELPRAVPYLDRPAFVYFDSSWTPVFQPLSYRCPIWWPLTGNAPDLEYTLQPFLQGVHGGDRESARQTRWATGFTASMLRAMAMIVALGVLGTSISLISIASTEINKAFFPEVAALTPEPPEDQVRRLFRESTRVTLHGRNVSYKIDVPESLLRKPTAAALQEYQLASDDNEITLSILAGNKEEDLSGFVDRRIKSHRTKGVESVRLVTNKTVLLDGTPWNEAHFALKTADGTHINELTYTHSSSRGTMILILQFVIAEETETQDLKAAYSILQSVKFTH